METIHRVSATSLLPQGELRSSAASTSRSSSSSSSSHPSLRLTGPRRNSTARSSLQAENVGGRPLSSAREFTFSFHSPLSPARRRSTWVQSSKKTYSSFDDLLQDTETPLLVDFYATWCGPCQFMVPILDEVGRVLKEKLRIVKVDTEKYPAIASRFGVQALPTLVLFLNGEPIDRLEGALSAPDLINRIEGVLSFNASAKA